MDALFPHLPRPSAVATPSSGPLISPVFKDARISAYDKNEKRFSLLLKQQQKKHSGQKPSSKEQPGLVPQTTPEEKQHVDDEGRLDIFV